LIKSVHTACFLDTGASLVETFWKEGGNTLVLDRYGLAGQILRRRAASRFDLES
jgi:hypothetical protein